MKKINEVFTITNGFFTELNNLNSELYNQLFGEYPPMLLNVNFLTLCGNRYISPAVSIADNLTNLTSIITAMYAQSWIKIKNALFADYDPIKPVKISITTDKELQSDKNIDNKNTENSYLYPFNENSEGINEGKNEAVTTNTTANTEKLTQTVIREGISNAKPTDLIRAEIQTRKITFLSLVLNDIKEYCTLQIYE